MPVQNIEIGKILSDVADLLEIRGANQFRVRPYRNAAQTIAGLSRSVADMVERGEDLTELPGIGKDLAQKLAQIVDTGTLPLLEKLERRLTPELVRLLKVPGLGPKRVKTIYDGLGIGTLEDLERAAESGKIRDLPGFGEKTEQTIREEIGRMKEEQERIKIAVVDHIAAPLAEYLKKAKGVKDVVIAGSYRRRKATVGDLDVLATCRRDSQIMYRFVQYEDVSKVVAQGKTRSTVLLRSGLQVDLRVVPQVSYGAALHYFTGSKSHNIAVRKMGQRKGLNINEYGVYRGKKRIAGKTEKFVYEAVQLPFIEPELREDRGEIDAARKNELPRLIALSRIRGDLHTHTKATDGKNTLEQMARSAKEMGYEYLANTEHSKHVTMARGLNKRRLLRQLKEIDRINKNLNGIFVLKSIEVDILEDGSLDLPDDVLSELDLTICAIHYKFNLSKEKQTERILRAMDNPRFNILAHPTGRMIGVRPPYELDIERIMKEAAERGCFLEVNARPERLDLSDIHCKMAKEIGVNIAISTDAHSTDGLRLMRFGVDQARRGWLQAPDVLNTRSWTKLRKLLKRQ
jgi:DNA polymerase (family 10)